MKKYNPTHYLLIILLLIIMVNAKTGWCQQTNIVKKDSNEASKTNSIIPIPQNEIEAYKLLYETSQKSYENQKDDIYWIFGLLVTFIVLIFSSQYIFNWRINKEEIERIKSDLEAKFQNELSNSKKEYAVQIKGILEDIKDKHGEQLSLYQLLIKDNNEKYLEYKQSIKENISLNNEIIKNQIQATETSLEKKIDDINANIDKVTGFVWSLRGVEINALRRFLKVLDRKIDQEDTVDITLDDINDSLIKINDLEIDMYEEVQILFKQVKEKYPKKFDQIIESILKQCDTKKLYEYSNKVVGGVIYVDEKRKPIVI